jgi:glycosyltransferase involved in cell wall biosynthesis
MNGASSIVPCSLEPGGGAICRTTIVHDCRVPAGGQLDRPRVAVLAQGDPTDPQTWSGSPAGLSAGLRRAGAEAIGIDAHAPGITKLARLLRVRWQSEAASPFFAGASGAWAARSIRTARPVDGAVTIGSSFLLKASLPTVTFEDETVAQALRQAISPLAALSERQIGRWRERQRQIYLRSRACCVGTEWTAESIRDDYGIDPGRVHVVGFGRNFDPTPAERDWSVPRFLFLGVEWELKRGPDVLEAFAEVRRRHPGATLDVAGEHPRIDREGVTGHGRLSLASPEDRGRLEDLLHRATCLVVPSNREAFGIAYVDAAAAGVPSIGTTVGGAPSTIGEGGRVVPPGDHEALVTAMLELCEPQTARDLGRLALERSRLFTWDAVAERVLRALRLPGVEIDGLAQFIEPAKG